MKNARAKIINRGVGRRLGELRDSLSMRTNAMWYVLSAAGGMPRAFSALGYELKCNHRYKSLNRGGQHIYWYRLGARLGDYIAAYNLGQCYCVGNGVPRNMRWAVFWWKKAAAVGYPLALTCLASAYYNGTGVKRDRKKALQLYGQASTGGDDVARKMLNQLNWDFCKSKRPGVKRHGK